MTLEELRKDIDTIDAHILSLLGSRMEKALLTRRLKADIRDSDREAFVLTHIANASRGLVKPAFSRELFERVIVESKAMQTENPVVAGFQGEHGAFSEMAIRAWDGKAAAIPCREFEDVFEAVESGLFDVGVVPVENTLGGVVGAVASALAYTSLHVVAAIDLPVEHCLISPPGADHREIRTVYSHPQALAQCRRFIERNRLRPEAYYDTAGAARMLQENAPAGAAAIASRLAAEIYDLDIIKEGIQDASINRTRFFILAREKARDEGDKCSVVFRAEDKAGALFKVLELFAKKELNLTRIESVPDKPGDYAIFMDFEGSAGDDPVKAALDAAASLARDFRLLGCYRERKI